MYNTEDFILEMYKNEELWNTSKNLIFLKIKYTLAGQLWEKHFLSILMIRQKKKNKPKVSKIL